MYVARDTRRPDREINQRRDNRNAPSSHGDLRSMNRVSRREELHKRSNFADFGRPSHQQPHYRFDHSFRTESNDQEVVQGINVEDSILEQAPGSSTEGQIHNLEGDGELARYGDSGRDNKKLKYKSRGSLQEGGEIQGRSRVLDLRVLKQKKFKQHRTVRLTQDVYIPTVVSVGQLARLLGVRLGLTIRCRRFCVRADSCM
jgi:hypothetical protein